MHAIVGLSPPMAFGKSGPSGSVHRSKNYEQLSRPARCTKRSPRSSLETECAPSSRRRDSSMSDAAEMGPLTSPAPVFYLRASDARSRPIGNLDRSNKSILRLPPDRCDAPIGLYASVVVLKLFAEWANHLFELLLHRFVTLARAVFDDLPIEHSNKPPAITNCADALEMIEDKANGVLRRF